MHLDFLRQYGRSFVYIINKRGPIMEPWGTPQLIFGCFAFFSKIIYNIIMEFGYCMYGSVFVYIRIDLGIVCH